MFALFRNLRQRFGFTDQANHPAAHRRQVRLSLEALDDRIVPTTNLIGAVPLATNSLASMYGTSVSSINPIVSPILQIDPAPLLAQTGTNAFTSTINLGLGPLGVQSQTYNNATRAWNFAGTFESMTQIPLFGFLVSDDIGSLSIASGRISPWPTSSGNGVFNGSMLSFYLNSMSFQASGDGTVGVDVGLDGGPDHQQVTFNGSVLSVWFNGQAVPVGVGGTIDIKDTVTISGFGPMTFDTSEAVPGTMFMGMQWASIQH